MPFRSHSTSPTLAARPTTKAKPARRGFMARFAQDIQAAFLEFIGTVMFLLIGLGGIQSVTSEANTDLSSTSGTGAATNNASSSVVERNMYISCVMGLSLLVSAWLFFRASGGLFNPNVSLALVLTGVITPVRFVLYCIAQLIGGITASALVLALMPGPLASNTSPGANVNSAQAVFIEMFITAALCLAVLMLGAEKHNATPFAPVGVGLTLFACHLWAVFYTGAAMNTARAFGPAVVTGFPSGRHWIYWVGPGLGSLLAAGIYAILRYFRYWRLNPGADETESDEVAEEEAQPGTDDVENARPPTTGEKGPRRV